jgi:hypothetical protein
MILSFLFFILVPESFSFHKDYKLVNDRAPLEFKLMFESMKYSLKEMNDQIRLIVLTQHINKGLAPLSKEQCLFLLKSEVYKALLEWPHSATQFQVGSHTLERMKKNLEAGKSVYTPYSQWILEALIADLEKFKQDGLLDLSPSQKSSLKGDKAAQYQKMQRVLKYTRGWLEQADTLSAKDFNHLSEQLAWRTLERVKEKAALFRRFSSKAIQDKQEDTFNIPEQGMPHSSGGMAKLSEKASDSPAGSSSQGEKVGQETPEYPNSTQAQEGLADEAQAAQASAEGTLQKIDPRNITLPPEDLSGAIDKIEAEEIR